jgi:hypothetical protein
MFCTVAEAMSTATGGLTDVAGSEFCEQEKRKSPAAERRRRDILPILVTIHSGKRFLIACKVERFKIFFKANLSLYKQLKRNF